MRLPRNMFYGWWIAIISASVDSLKHGTFNKGFTSYIIPLRNELGIGVAAISFAEMLGRMEGGLQGPFMGWATDRFGPRGVGQRRSRRVLALDGQKVCRIDREGDDLDHHLIVCRGARVWHVGTASGFVRWAKSIELYGFHETSCSEGFVGSGYIPL